MSLHNVCMTMNLIIIIGKVTMVTVSHMENNSSFFTKSSKIRTVALSSTEVECIALCYCAHEILI